MLKAYKTGPAPYGAIAVASALGSLDMKQVITCAVISKVELPSEKRYLKIARNFYGLDLSALKLLHFYHLEEKNARASAQILTQVLIDEIYQELLFLNKDNTLARDFEFAVLAHFLPGVTDNSGKSASEAFKILGHECQVQSGTLVLAKGVASGESKGRFLQFVQENLSNAVIQDARFFDSTFFSKEHFFHAENAKPSNSQVETINLDRPIADLVQLSGQRCWALNQDELSAIKEYFLRPQVQSMRLKNGPSPMPTDVEIEVIAQTWSEHCKHKIFGAQVDYQEDLQAQDLIRVGSKKIDSLFKTYIKRATEEVIRERKIDWAISLFSDNAGIVRFDKNIDVCIKVETHNSPSALDPYGGALTGILGVNRDILGCGLGAKPVANLDVFCFCDPKWPAPQDKNLLPLGLLHPKRILEGVHKGVEDGGNKSGIPTIGGAFFFDYDFAGKPLVYVGTIGVMPQKIAGRQTHVKEILPGDLVLVAGGAVGRDGIHGATFSSLQLDESFPASVVQIGDPLTQKRLTDFLLAARDLNLFRALTDNGAGGISSSVGEMALLSGGVRIDLHKCPLKYPGLLPFEIMVSESQERMSFAVPPENKQAMLELAGEFGVQASCIGEFTDSGKMQAWYQNEMVADLELAFLHQGAPTKKMTAKWQPRKKDQENRALRKMWGPHEARANINASSHSDILLRLLSRPNICSKWPLIKKYDQGVGARTVLAPFQGMDGEAPNNAGGIWAKPLGGEDYNGFLTAVGMAPRMSLYDPYLMTVWSVDEAIRNIVVQGADPQKICLLDNFCWPDPELSSGNPQGDMRMGELVRACEGLRACIFAFGTPLVSGKDSMKNNFRGKLKSGENVEIDILPTLLVTSLGQWDIRHKVTPDFGPVGSRIYLLGQLEGSLAASELAEIFQGMALNLNFKAEQLTKLPALYQSFHQALTANLILGAHDISDGGLMVALAEGLFARGLGAELELPQLNNSSHLPFLYGEGPGRILVAVAPDKTSAFEEYFKHQDCHYVASVTAKSEICWQGQSVTTAQALSAFNKESWE